MHYLLTQIPGMLIGFLLGAFTPAVGRYIKGFFVKKLVIIDKEVTSKFGKHS